VSASPPPGPLYLERLEVGVMQNWAYLVGSRAKRQCLVVDPAWNIDAILRKAAQDGMEVVGALVSHWHPDHVGGDLFGHDIEGLATLLTKKSVPIHVNRLELEEVAKVTGVSTKDLVGHDGGDRVEVGDVAISLLHTPGHTPGSQCFLCAGHLLSGDTLFIRGCGRTDFQQGDARALYRAVREQIFSLPDRCLVYPGHDYRGLTVTSVGEEKLYNPRLAESIGENDFVGYMTNLGLPHPKQMDVAVPANLKCGKPEKTTTLDPDWAPLTYTFGGIWEVQPHWLEEHLRDVQVVDVREPDEFNGPLGHVPGARLVPLGSLMKRVEELQKEQPVVTVCRSGARSAQATVLLGKAGFDKVANLSGGMLRWRAQRFSVEGGAD